MADYGLKVSKAGYSVLTTGDENLIYSSKYDTLRVFAQGSGSMTSAYPTTTIITIAHNLGYRPAFTVYSEVDSGFGGANDRFFMLPLTWAIGGDASIEAYCDSTNLKIRYGGDHTPNGVVLDYKYYIYYNQAY